MEGSTTCHRPPTLSGRYTIIDLVAPAAAALLLSAGSAIPAVAACTGHP